MSAKRVSIPPTAHAQERRAAGEDRLPKSPPPPAFSLGEQLRLTQALAHVGTWYLDIVADRFQWSKEAGNILGLDQPPQDFEQFVQRLYPGDREALRAAWTEALSGTQPFRMEFRVLREGEVGWVEQIGLLDLAPGGMPLSARGTLQDVTLRKQHEEELREKHLYTRSLIDSRVDAMVTISPNGLITDVNPSMEELTGIPRQQLVGTQFQQHFTQPERAAEGLRQVMQEGRVTELELTVLARDGRLTTVAYNASKFFSQHHQLLGVIAVARDVSEHNRMLRDLARRSEELERSNRELQDFAAAASHDLQEPLRKVMAFGDRLRAQAGTSLDETSADYLDRMQTAAQRMSSLVECLLDYSRVTTRARPMGNVQLGHVMADVLDDLEERIRQSGARIRVGSLPEVQADRTQMHRLLLNLVSNAIKFQRAGHPPSVRISSRRIPGAWLVMVADNGIGFDPKYQDRIFRPFHRLHSRSEYEGSGMGLAICRKIVERHQGAITTNSRPGRGAIFTLSLPTPIKEDTP